MDRLRAPLLVALVALIVGSALPSGADGSSSLGGRLVEGHTVHLVTGGGPVVGPPGMPNPDSPIGLAIGMAVGIDGDGTLFAGLRWFNDQYVLNSLNAITPPEQPQRAFGAAILVATPDGATPCSGAALVVPSGAPDPRTWLAADSQYVESYLVTDPMDGSWTIDVWRDSTRREVVLVVPILGLDGALTKPPGGLCSPHVDRALARPGTSGASSNLRYNAFIVAFPETFTLREAPADHDLGAPERAAGVRAGSSHGTHPVPDEAQRPETMHGEGGHHATTLVDVYAGVGFEPPIRTFTWFDTEGARAPYS